MFLILVVYEGCIEILSSPNKIFKKIAVDAGLKELHNLYVDKDYILNLSKPNHSISY